MNVLIVSEPGIDGVFAYVEALCHYLIDRGITVNLGYSDKRGSDRLAALVKHVEGNGGLTLNLEIGGSVGLADLRAFRRLWKFAAVVRPDIVHCHSSKAGALGRSLAFVGVRSTFVYQPHAYFGMRPDRAAVDSLYDAIEAFLGRIGTTVAISLDEKLFALRRLRIPAKHIVLIANGIDTNRFLPATREEKQSFREFFGIPPQSVVLGAIARLSSQKDPITLYRAFASAAQARPDLHLFHVGTGELEAQVDRLAVELGISQRVTRVRYLANPVGFYGAVDGVILTSTYEGLSLAALEAMSANLPLILSRAPGNIGLLDLRLSHAWGAKPGAAEEFAQCIGRWHASHLLNIPPNHRRIAMENFDSRASQAAVLSHYRRVAGGTGRPEAGLFALFCVLLWVGLIACESTDAFSRAHTYRLLYPIFHLLTGVTRGDFFNWNNTMRKVGHVFLYGVLSALVYRLAWFKLGHSRPKVWSIPCAAIALAATVLAGGLDEWHQTSIPSRTGTLSDVFLDGSAGLAALGIIFLGRSRFGSANGRRAGRIAG